MKALKEEADKAKKIAEDMETKYHDIQAQYDLLKLDLEDSTQKTQRLEKQLKVAQAANLAQERPIVKQPSKKIIHQNIVCSESVLCLTWAEKKFRRQKIIILISFSVA